MKIPPQTLEENKGGTSNKGVQVDLLERLVARQDLRDGSCTLFANAVITENQDLQRRVILSRLGRESCWKGCVNRLYDGHGSRH